MRFPKVARRWLAVALVAVVAVVAVRALDGPSRLDYVRIADDHTLIVGTAAGRGAWTRVTNIAETPATVTISVNSLLVQLGPGAVDAVPIELTATLHDPIGDRTVIDGSTGLAVPRTSCLPPAVLAPGCTP